MDIFHISKSFLTLKISNKKKLNEIQHIEHIKRVRRPGTEYRNSQAMFVSSQSCCVDSLIGERK